jgi:2,4-dienoyl-CoA reductase-like NADH-dependent reductase (Old Yellow Enzyme family)
VVEAAHAEGTRIVPQLNHGGRKSIPKVSGSIPLAPSPIASQLTGVGDAVVPKELTPGEIDPIIERFAEAARRASDAGFDAVELHGAHGYLIGEFLSPDSNKRQEEYGGSVQGRAHFSVRLIRAIKARHGEDYPVIVRMNGRDHVRHGLELGDAVEMAAMFEAAGADSISVSGVVHASRPYMVVPGMSVDRGCYVSYGDAIRRRIGIPVMVVGRINATDLAEQILNDGPADFICLSRALIADPYFPAKATDGRAETIAPCIACNECIATVHRHKGLACTVNPMVSRELKLKPLLVRLFEKDSAVGGQLLLAHQPAPPRRDMERAALFHPRSNGSAFRSTSIARFLRIMRSRSSRRSSLWPPGQRRSSLMVPDPTSRMSSAAGGSLRGSTALDRPASWSAAASLGSRSRITWASRARG